MNNSATHVIVGMSGGVDSSVAALLLLQQGYRVAGLFMQNWEEEDDDQCTAIQDYRDAAGVCQRLGIQLHTVNFSGDYWDRVFSHFLQEYQAGRTPNPDVMCNKEIKFNAFLEYAKTLGADYIATGHYAQCKQTRDGIQLLRGLDANKDQTYFLYTLGQSQLKHTLFPIGELSKSHVRVLAQEAKFHNHRKKDSTGICFIGERKFTTFLANYLPAQPGSIISDTGEVLGEHQGLMFHTLGQRQGLGIGGRRKSGGEPWYVIDKCLDSNHLIVAQGHNHPRLFKTGLKASQLHWCNAVPNTVFTCTAKVRYRQEDQACTVSLNADHTSVDVSFEQSVRAITPGQSIVFYQREVCLGGGIIE